MIQLPCSLSKVVVGGVDNLVEWARCNQTEFYRMLSRLLPREVEATVVSQSSLVDALMEVEDYVKYERTLTDNGK